MELFIIRHGRAEDREAFAVSGRPDAERPLTPDGKHRFRAAARGLVTLADRLDGIVTSPLRRARETAAILGEAYQLTPQLLPVLAPGGDAARTTDWLAGESAGRLALVGHEPDLGRLAAYLLTGAEADFLPLKKGAVCGIHFEGPVHPGAARLRFLLAASHLRRLGGAN